MLPNPTPTETPQLAPRLAPRLAPQLSGGQLHEIHADIAGWAAALAFALSGAAAGSAPLLLVRMRRGAPLSTIPHAQGLAQMGLDPARLILIEAADAPALLRAALEGARCGALAAVVLETWGPLRDYDLVASRRLVLAAEASRVPVILLRGGAEPRPSAAHTRWQVSSTPSATQSAEPLLNRLPGPATITLDLLRQRGGPAGAAWRLQWNDDDACFQPVPLAPARPLFGAVMAGTVVSLSALRKDVDAPSPVPRQAA
jgi:protein ImuA